MNRGYVLTPLASDVRDDTAVWVWAMLENDAVDAGTQSQLRNIVRDLVHRETGATC